MNDRLLKNLILKEIHSVLKEEQDTSKEQALTQLNLAVAKLKEVFSGDEEVESFATDAETLMDHLVETHNIDMDSELSPSELGEY